MSRLYLKVPFAQKDVAKELGAMWERDKKLWYVVSPCAEDLKFFAQVGWLIKKSGLDIARDEYMAKRAS